MVITAPTATLAGAERQQQTPRLAQGARALPSEPGRRYQCCSSLPPSSSLRGRLWGGPSGGFWLFLL